MTPEMEARTKHAGVQWRDEGEGYYSGSGNGPLGIVLAYIAVPENHPAVGKHYDELDPPVNGGFTFSKGNVFGWDYGHAYNSGSPATDIPAALEFLRNYKE